MVFNKSLINFVTEFIYESNRLANKNQNWFSVFNFGLFSFFITNSLHSNNNIKSFCFFYIMNRNLFFIYVATLICIIGYKIYFIKWNNFVNLITDLQTFIFISNDRIVYYMYHVYIFNLLICYYRLVFNFNHIYL